MPPKRSFRKKTTRRRKTYTKRKSRRARIPRSRGLIGFPSKKLMKLKYVQEVQIDPAAGAIAYLEFRANSVFAPMVAGTMGAHQPMYFDQMMAIYNKYCVIGSVMKATYANSTTGNMNPGFFGIYKSTNATALTAYTDINGIREGPGSRNTALRQIGLAGTAQGWGPTSVKSTFSARKDLSVPSPLSNTNIDGSIGTNPTDVFYWSLFVADMQGDDPGSMNFLVEITYTVVFTDLYSVTQS